MHIREYRFLLPLTLEEHNIGRLHTILEDYVLHAKTGNAMEMIVNEPRDEGPNAATVKESKIAPEVCKGQYTHKKLHLNDLPSFIQMLAPNGSAEAHEKAMNAYPYCYTEYSNPYMKENFFLRIDSVHTKGRDFEENIFKLDEEELKQRVIDVIHITQDKVDPADDKEEDDPLKAVTSRGPLATDWQTSSESVICCYALVRLEFKWFGLQDKVENTIIKKLRRIYLNLNRRLVSHVDDWLGMTIEDIRNKELKVKDKLDQIRNHPTAAMSPST